MKYIIFLTSLLSYSSFCSATDASAYIENMLKQYAKLNSYEDTGTSIDIDTETNGNTSQEKLTFTTEYKRNDIFKLTWIKHPDDLEKQLGIKPREYSFWKNNNGIYTKYHYNNGAVTYTNFTDAISSVAGVSNELAFFVPRFLGANETCLPNLGAKETEVVKSNATKNKDIH